MAASNQTGAHSARTVRVVLTGAESTGKTTLARDLAAHYNTVWLPEYLRRFVDERGALPEASDTLLIAQGHVQQEDRLLPTANRVLFLDTDLASTCLYHEYYFGVAPPAWVCQEARSRQADLYLFMDIDVPWKPDGMQRESPEVRVATHRLFVDAMAGRPHVLVSGPWKQRFGRAVRAVDRLLGLGQVHRAAEPHVEQ